MCKYLCDAKAAAELYQKLVAISHWTEADFQCEMEIKQACQDNKIQPDYSVNSFEQLITIIQAFNDTSL